MSAPTGLDRAEITALLERWTAGGFIDAELADRMRADVTGPGTDRGPVAADRRPAVGPGRRAGPSTRR